MNLPLLSQRRTLDEKKRIVLPTQFPHLETIVSFTTFRGIHFTSEELFERLLEENQEYMKKLKHLQIDSNKRVNLNPIISEMNLRKEVNVISYGRYFDIVNY